MDHFKWYSVRNVKSPFQTLLWRCKIHQMEFFLQINTKMEFWHCLKDCLHLRHCKFIWGKSHVMNQKYILPPFMWFFLPFFELKSWFILSFERITHIDERLCLKTKIIETLNFPCVRKCPFFDAKTSFFISQDLHTSHKNSNFLIVMSRIVGQLVLYLVILPLLNHPSVWWSIQFCCSLTKKKLDKNTYILFFAFFLFSIFFFHP